MQSKTKNILITGCLLMALAVGIGAFGAHGLKETLLQNEKLEVFETGVKYHFYHAISILIIGILSIHIQNRWIHRSFYMMLTGIIFFSVSLYVLAITNTPILGAITPIGGLLFLVGWVFLVLGIKKGN
ncbi:MAG: DUF423 domain-containing protein [Bacteroidota bacterium]